MSPLSSTNERGRFAAGLLLLGAVHIALFFRGGNENATPPRLLLSFALSTTVLWLSQLARRRLQEQRAARAAALRAAPAAHEASPVSSEVPR
jgi:hypothetical protein